MEMRNYIIRRVLLIIPVLFGVTIIIFVILCLFSPEQRAATFITDVKQLRNIQSIIKMHHLDAPLYVQYFYWLNAMFHGNLGWSKTASRPTLEALFYFLPNTVELGLFSIFPIVLIGIWLGSASAVHQDKFIDHTTRTIAIVGWSLPTFWFGLLLLMVFYGYFGGLFPPDVLSINSDLYVHSPDFIRFTHINTIDAILNWKGNILLDALRHLVLPVITLTVVQCALIMRIMRSSMLEALGKGYVTTARAKGADEKTVVKKHARRNAMIPVITVSGYLFAGLMNGVVITEAIFNRKGLGWWWWRAAVQLDVPAILGAVLFNGMLFVITNLVVDLLYAYIDPRVRLG